MQLEPVARVAALKEAWGGWKTFGNSATAMVDINVYGHQHSSQTVAKYLNSSRIFLQPPVADPRQLTYDNPQYLKLPTVSRIEEIHSPE
jgi:SWI/SNF-related matrix-associated actin-dependent regulator of chromatin subfamily A3